MAMVAIEMILTLGHQLGKGFDLAAYANAIADAGDEADAQSIEQRARQNAAAMLKQLAQTSTR